MFLVQRANGAVLAPWGGGYIVLTGAQFDAINAPPAGPLPIVVDDALGDSLERNLPRVG